MDEDSKELTVGNSISFSLGISNKTKVGVLVADGTFGMSNQYVLGFKSVCNYIQNTIGGISLSLGATLTLKAKTANYQEYYDSSCDDGFITMTSLSNYTVQSGRLALLAGYGPESTGLGAPNLSGMTKGDFKASATVSKTELTASDKLILSSQAPDQQAKSEARLAGGKIAIKLKNGKVTLAAGAAYTGGSNITTTNAALIMDGSSIIMQGGGGNAGKITVKQDKITLAAGTGESSLENASATLVKNGVFQATPASINLLGSNFTPVLDQVQGKVNAG